MLLNFTWKFTILLKVCKFFLNYLFSSRRIKFLCSLPCDLWGLFVGEIVSCLVVRVLYLTFGGNWNMSWSNRILDLSSGFKELMCFNLAFCYKNRSWKRVSSLCPRLRTMWSSPAGGDKAAAHVIIQKLTDKQDY